MQEILTPTLKNYKNYKITNPEKLLVSDPDPLKLTKLPSKHLILGHHQHANETSFKMAIHCWVDDGRLIAVFESFLLS